MATLHQKLAVAVVLAALFGTLWALYRAYSGSLTRRLVVAGWCVAALVLVEGVIGSVLGITGARPDSGSHFVVGPLTLLPLPLALFMSRRLRLRAAAIVVATGWVVTTGLALRATGSGGLGA
jgi:hypothetical protein